MSIIIKKKKTLYLSFDEEINDKKNILLSLSQLIIEHDIDKVNAVIDNKKLPVTVKCLLTIGFTISKIEHNDSTIYYLEIDGKTLVNYYIKTYITISKY
jgi:hypothetical protein